MKRLALILALLFADSAFATTAFNVWTPQGNVVPNSLAGGSVLGNPQVLYDTNPKILTGNTNVFKMWAGVSANGSIYYFESVDGITNWTAYASNPIIGINTAYVPTVTKQGSTYYMYASTSTGAGNPSIQTFTSVDGLSWTLGGTALSPGGAGAWDVNGVFQLNIADTIAGTTYGYYSGVSGTHFGQGLATSTDNIHWTKSANNPIFSEQIGNSFILKVDSSHYYFYAHLPNPNAQLAANTFDPIYRWFSPSPSGPWTQLEYLGVPVSTYYMADTADFVPSFQLSTNLNDQCMVVANGNIYIYYTLTHSGGNEIQINAAVAANITPAQLTATYEGVFNVPSSGNPQLNLTTLASDAGTGVNANPIGGIWTPVSITGNFQNAQRVSNLFEAASSSAISAACYDNTYSGGADQWSMVTVNASVSTSTVGAIVRASTTGGGQFYRFRWVGALGSPGSFIAIDKIVAGSGSNLFTTNTQAVQLTVNSGDTIMGVAVGSNPTTLLFYWNGNLLATYVDSSSPLQTGSPGFTVVPAGGSASDAALSAWSGGTFQDAPPIGGGNAGGRAVIF